MACLCGSQQQEFKNTTNHKKRFGGIPRRKLFAKKVEKKQLFYVVFSFDFLCRVCFAVSLHEELKQKHHTNISKSQT
jgi:hypothetical protein